MLSLLDKRRLITGFITDIRGYAAVSTNRIYKMKNEAGRFAVTLNFTEPENVHKDVWLYLSSYIT